MSIPPSPMHHVFKLLFCLELRGSDMDLSLGLRSATFLQHINAGDSLLGSVEVQLLHTATRARVGALAVSLAKFCFR